MAHYGTVMQLANTATLQISGSARIKIIYNAGQFPEI
jgi:hypothetical protein